MVPQDLTLWDAEGSQTSPSVSPGTYSAVRRHSPRRAIPPSSHRARQRRHSLGGGWPHEPLSVINTSGCDNHFFPWERDDDVISRALLPVHAEQARDPSSTINCLRVGINLVSWNIQKPFVGRWAGSMCSGRPGGRGPSHAAPAPWRAPCILMAAPYGRLFPEVLFHGLHYHAELRWRGDRGWARRLLNAWQSQDREPRHQGRFAASL